MPPAINEKTMTARPVAIEWNPGLSIFASESFLKTLGDDYGWLGGFDEDQKLRCILPYTILRKAVFCMIRFRVQTIPVAAPLDFEEEKSFLNSAVDYFRSIGADLIIPASNNTIFRTCPNGAVAAPYGSYIIDLTQSEEDLWTNLHSKHRNVIRNAMKAGVQIRNGIEHLDTVYAMVRDTLKRSGLRFMSRAAFGRLIHGLGGGVRLFVAEHQGVVQGCAMFPFSNHSAYYVYGGSIPEPSTGAMNLLHWEAIRAFRTLGVGRYDFVGVRIDPEKGSKQEGLMRFKERFGGELVKGCMWKYSFNRFKYLAYGLAVRLRRGGDIVDQERHKLPDAPEFGGDSVGNAKHSSPGCELTER
jgi:hypothetical protein